jgi:quinol-cytochrome oxidoreductase complex cytochrome b subunit
VELTAAAQIAHRVAGLVFVALGLAVGVMAVVSALRRRRVGAGLVGVTFLIAGLAASFSGSLLPWDQLGLWTVTVGRDIKGYAPIVSGDEIRFVIVGTSRISTDTFTRWFFTHEIVIPVVLIGLGIVLFRATNPRQASVEPEPESQ